MTITYQNRVATTTFFGFFKLLSRWRGSIYKLLYKETIVFVAFYTIISLIYRLALNTEQRRLFEQVVRYCDRFTNLIPVSFVLGFYVTVVVQRWWQQFINAPWPDRTLFVLGSYLVGQDDGTRILRRTVARYLLSALILILRSVSVSVMKRYPTMDHIVEAGYITKEEVVMYEQVNCKYHKFWVPLVWANNILTQARKEGRIESDIGFRLTLEYLADFRDKCSICFVYDWITIPLVYTQVVTLAVYTFFGACLVGRQYIEKGDKDHPDLYIPVFTVLQFFFYMGWLKVAESLINPFGEDDDDFDMNWLLDRHAAVAMCYADQCHGSYPPLIKDIHFDEIVNELPYTKASAGSIRPNFLGSTYNLAPPSLNDQMAVNPMTDAPICDDRLRANTGPLRSGSLWTLFGLKSNQKGVMSDLHETMQYNLTVGNGHAGKYDSRHSEPAVRKLSINSETGSVSDIPPEQDHVHRARAKSDAGESKMPFLLNIFHRKHEKEPENGLNDFNKEDFETNVEYSPFLTPRMQVAKSRFLIETVTDNETDVSKQTRSKQHLPHANKSRQPHLSAIEEGNTIKSISDIARLPTIRSQELFDDEQLPTIHLMEQTDDEHSNDVKFSIPVPNTDDEDGEVKFDEDVFEECPSSPSEIQRLVNIQDTNTQDNPTAVANRYRNKEH